MKRFLITIAAILLASSTACYAIPEEIFEVEQKPIQQEQTTPKAEITVTFDWLDVSQQQREEYIKEFKTKLFETNTSKIAFDKEEFKTKFKPFMKDRNFKHHYFYVNNGITEDEEAKYCAFYYKNDTLMIYAIQYKDNPRQAFYYSPFGKMYYADIMSDEYPNFPYTSMQYDRKGKLSSAIYFVSRDLQYMFGPDKEFQGVWYKDKLYDKNGKQTLTRNNW